MVNGRMLEGGKDSPKEVEGSPSSTSSPNRNILIKKEDPMVSAFSGTRVTVNIPASVEERSEFFLLLEQEIQFCVNSGVYLCMELDANSNRK